MSQPSPSPLDPIAVGAKVNVRPSSFWRDNIFPGEWFVIRVQGYDCGLARHEDGDVYVWVTRLRIEVCS